MITAPVNLMYRKVHIALLAEQEMAISPQSPINFAPGAQL